LTAENVMVAAAKLAVVAGAWLLVPAKCCRFVAASICGGDCGNGVGAMVLKLAARRWRLQVRCIFFSDLVRAGVGMKRDRDWW